MSALLLCFLFGLFLVIPSVSSETEAQLHGNASLYSHWHGGALEDTSELLLDEDIAGESADLSVGSFSLHRPQSELFMKGLLGELYDIAAGAAVESGDIENYLQARARAQIMDTAPPDFKQWLSSRGEGVTERIFVNSADYLTDYLTTAAVDNAEGLNFIRTVEWDYQSSLGSRRWQTGISALGALREGADDAVAWQLRGYAAEDSGIGANAGLIYRRAVNFGGAALVGANVFLDYEEHGDYDEDFLRWSAGAEYRNAYVDIYLNRYFPINNAVLRDGSYLYTQGGEEAYINLKIPELSIGQFSAGFTYYRWKGKYGDADDKGLRYHIHYSPRWSDWRFELELDSPEGDGVNWGGQINYHHIIGSAKKGVGIASAGVAFDARSHFFESVRREYAQRIRSSAAFRIVVARVLDDSTGTAQFVIQDPAPSTVTTATAVTLSVVNGVGETHTLTLSAHTISITVEMGTAVELSASNWLATVYEGGMDRLAETGGRLEIVRSSVAFERFGDGLNTLLAGNVTIDLLGTKGKAGVPAPPSGYDLFTHLVDGDIALTVLARNRMSVELFGFSATAFVHLPPSFFALEDTEATVQLALACSTTEQRDNHRIFQLDYTGCVGDVRLSDLAADRTVYLHAQGRDLTLAGVAGGGIAMVEAGVTSTIVYDSYPFHPHNATLRVLNGAVSISHGRASGELAELAVEVNSSVAFAFVGAAAGATATTAVSIYAAVFGGTVSGIGAADNQVGCLNHLESRSEGLVSVITSCSAIGFPNAGDSLDVVGRVGIERTYEVEVAGGTGEYAFELVGADSTMALAAPTGSAAVLVISPDTVPSDKISYRLRVSPLPSDDEEILFVEPAELDVYLRVLEGFRLINPAAPGFIRTEIDEDLPLYRVLHEGSVDNQVDIDLCLCLDDFIPNTTTEHPFRKYFAVDIDNQEVKVETAIPPEEIAGTAGITGRSEPTLADLPVDVPVLVAATDVHTSDDQLTATESLSFVVTVRHPSGDVQSTYNYASTVRNGNYAVYVRGAGDDILAFSDTGNAPDSNGVSVSGISVGGHYRYGFVGAAPSGFVLVTSAAPGAFAALQVDGNAPPSAGQHRMTVQIEDDHSLTAPFLVTVSVQMVDALALAAVPAGVEKSAPHRVDEYLFRVEANGGLAPYRYDIVGGNDSGHAKIAADAGDAGIGVVRLAKEEDEHTELALAIRVTDSKEAMGDVTVPVTLLDGLALTDPGAVILGSPHGAGKALFTITASGGSGGANGVNYGYALLTTAQDNGLLEVVGSGLSVTVRLAEEVTNLPRSFEVTVQLSDGGNSAATTRVVAVNLLDGLALTDPGAVEFAAPHGAGKVLFTITASGGSGGDNGINYGYALLTTEQDEDLLEVVGSGLSVTVRLAEEVTNLPRDFEVTVQLSDGGKSPAITRVVAVNLLDGLALTDPGAVILGSPHGAGKALFTITASGGNGGANGINYGYALLTTAQDNGLLQVIGDGLSVTVRLAEDITNLPRSFEVTVQLSDGGESAATTRVVAVNLLDGLALTDPGAVEFAAPHGAGKALFTITASGGNGGANGVNYGYALLTTAQDNGLLQVIGSGLSVTVRLAEDITNLPRSFEVTVQLSDGGKSAATTRVVAVNLLDGLALTDPGAVILGSPHGAGKALFTITASGGSGGANGVNYGYALLTTEQDEDLLEVVGDGLSITVRLAENITNLPRSFEVTVQLSDGGESAAITRVVAVNLLDGLALTDPGAVILGSPHGAGKALFTITASGGSGGDNGVNYGYALLTTEQDNGLLEVVGSGLSITVRLAEEVTDLPRGFEVTVQLSDGGKSPAITRVVAVNLLDGLALTDPGAVILGSPHGAGKALFTITASGGSGGDNGVNYGYALLTTEQDNGLLEVVGSGLSVTVRLAENITNLPRSFEVTVQLSDGGSSAATTRVVAVNLLDGLALTDPGAVILGSPHGAGNVLFTITASGGNGGANGVNYGYALLTTEQDNGLLQVVGDGLSVTVRLAEEVTNLPRGFEVTVQLSDGGKSPAITRVVAVNLLDGLVLTDPGAVILGSPHGAGKALFTITASGGSGGDNGINYGYALLTTAQDNGLLQVIGDGLSVTVRLAEDITNLPRSFEVTVQLSDGGESAATTRVVAVNLLDGLALTDPGAVILGSPHGAGKALFTITASGGNGGANGVNYGYALLTTAQDNGLLEVVGDGLSITVRLAEDITNLPRSFEVTVQLSDGGKSPATTRVVAVNLLDGLALTDPGAVILGSPHGVGKALFTITASGGNGGANGVNYGYALLTTEQDEDLLEVVGSGLSITVRLAEDITNLPRGFEVTVQLSDGGSSAATTRVVAVNLLDGLALTDPGAVEFAAPHGAGKVLFTITASGGSGGDNGINYGYALLTTEQDEDLLEVVGSGLSVTVRLAEEVTNLPRDFEVTVQLSDGGKSPAITRVVAVNLLDGLALTDPGAVILGSPHGAGKALFTITASGGNGGVSGINYGYALLTTEQDNGLLQVIGDGLSVTVRLAEEVTDLPRDFEVTVQLSDGGESAATTRVVAVNLLDGLALTDPGAVEFAAPHGAGKVLFTITASGGSGGDNGVNYGYALLTTEQDNGLLQVIGDGLSVTVRLAEEVTDLPRGFEVTVQLSDGGSSAATTRVVAVNLLPDHILVIGGDSGGANNEVWRSLDGANWTQLTAPAAQRFPVRYSHAAVALNGTVYVSGGSDGTNHLNDVWASADGVHWTLQTREAAADSVASRRFSARSGHDMLAYQGTLFVIGGTNGDINADGGFASLLNDIWYSADGGVNWDALSGAAGACANRTLPLSFVYAQRVIVAGGYRAADDGEFTLAEDVRAFDGENCGGSFGDLPPPVTVAYGAAAQKHAGVLLDREMYILGAGNVFASANGSGWEAKTDSAAFGDLSNHAAVVHQGTILVIGGRAGTDVSGRVWASTGGENWAEKTAVAGALPGRIRHAAVVLGTQSFTLPPPAPPLVLTGPTEVVKPEETHSLGRELFTVVASGGAGGYAYSIASASPAGHIGIDAASGVASIAATVDVSTRIIINTRVTDADNDTADFEVIVDLLRPLVVTGPTELVYSTSPHTEGRDLFMITVRGGTESYTYGIGAVDPADLAGNFGISGGSVPVAPEEAGGEVTLAVTLAATVAAASRATMTVTVSDGDQTAQLDITVQLSAVVNHILVIGGLSDDGTTNEVWWSEDGQGWTQLAEPSSAEQILPARYDHAAVAVDGTVYVSGGFAGGQYLSDVWASTDGMRWRRQSSGGFFSARHEHQMFAYDNRLFIMGGSDGSRNLANDVWASGNGGVSWTQVANVADVCDSRQHHQAFVYQRGVVIVGGITPEGNNLPPNYDVRLFDGESCSDDSLGTVPGGGDTLEDRDSVFRSRAGGLAGVLYNDDIYITGNSQVYVSSDSGANWLLTTAAAGFSSAGAFNVQGSDAALNLVNHAMVSHDGAMFIIGGYCPDSGCPSNPRIGNVWSSTNGVDWEIRARAAEPAVGSPLPGRWRHAAVALGPQSFAAPPKTPLVLSGPTEVVQSTTPHIAGTDLFEVTARGGDANDYTYSIHGVAPASLAPHFGISGNGTSRRTSPNEAVTLMVTLKATVTTAARATVTIEVRNGDQTAQLDVTVQLSAVANYLLAIGGIIGIDNESSNDVWRSLDGQDWTQLPAPPVPFIFESRYDHAAAVLGGTVYISGGCCQTVGVHRGYDDVWASADGVRWTLKSTGTRFPGRFAHAMFAYDNKLFVAGGNEPLDVIDKRYRNDIWHSGDGVDWTQISADTSACSNRRGLVPFVYRDRVLLVGGETEMADPANPASPLSTGFATDVRSFNGENCGGSLGNLPAQAATDFSSHSWLQPRGVVFDGSMHIVGRAAAWSSPNGGIWTKHSGTLPFSELLFSHEMAVHDNKMFIIGGGTGDPSGDAAIWSFSDSEEGWNSVANSTLPDRNLHAVAAMGPQSTAPRLPAAPLALLTPSGLVKSQPLHRIGKELFTATAVGGSGGYEYSVVRIDVLSPSTAENKDYVTINADTGVVSINEEVAAVTRMRVFLQVRDTRGAIANGSVLVEQFPPLQLVVPTEVVESQNPHTVGGELFQAYTIGGDGDGEFEYAFKSANDHIGINSSSGSVTIKAVVTVSTRIELIVVLSDESTGESLSGMVTVDLFPPRRVVMFGGQYGEAASTFRNDVWASLDGEHWTLLTRSATFGGRTGIAATQLGGTLYFSGGTINGTSRVNSVWSSVDGVNWTWRNRRAGTKRFPARYHHKMVAAGGALYVLGGIGNDGTLFSDLWQSTDEGETWRLLKGVLRRGNQVVDGFEDVGSEHESFVAFGTRGRVWAFGRRDNFDLLWFTAPDEGWHRNVTSSEWEDILGIKTTGPFSRRTPLLYPDSPFHPHVEHRYFGAAGTVFNDRLYIFAHDRIFSSDGGSWREDIPESSPYARYPLNTNSTVRRVGHQVVAINNKILIVGGVFHGLDELQQSDESGANRLDNSAWLSVDENLNNWREVESAADFARVGHALVVQEGRQAP